MVVIAGGNEVLLLILAYQIFAIIRIFEPIIKYEVGYLVLNKANFQTVKIL